MVLGAVIPVLLEDKVFGVTPPTATAIATTGLIGMTIGAMAIGTITDYLGRRQVMIFAAAIFSIFTLAVAFPTSVFTFGLYRFLAGLGLGGQATVTAKDGEPHLHILASAAELPRLEDVIGRHLVRFGQRDELTVTWNGTAPHRASPSLSPRVRQIGRRAVTLAGSLAVEPHSGAPQVGLISVRRAPTTPVP